MKKKLITMVLVVAMICTLIVGSASALSASKSVGGASATCILNWNANYNGAYSTSSCGVVADRIYAYVYYQYTLNGVSGSVSDDHAPGRGQSAQASAYKTGSVYVSRSSSHIIEYNGDVWYEYLP